ncbi:hypothetical protein TrVE_jg10472 [Triparma verrucosa]|uniref:Uncharacterized protein n=1 Tax=Triparma verrucosa TaxID=1606542 RepID=A0A9W7CHF9_9STRA|nr:hypothetical protein TrVE_jg10472 [Triparma verrucosa]
MPSNPSDPLLPPPHSPNSNSDTGSDSDNDENASPHSSLAYSILYLLLAPFLYLTRLFKPHHSPPLLTLNKNILLPLLTGLTGLIISHGGRLVFLKVLSDVVEPERTFWTFFVLTFFCTVLPTVPAFVLGGVKSIKKTLLRLTSKRYVSKKSPPPPPNYTQPSSFPMTSLILTSVLDLLASLLQFTLLPLVPGILSVILLSTTTLYNYLFVDRCSNHTSLHLTGLSFYVLSFLVCLLPSVIYLSTSQSIDQSTSILTYSLTPLLTSLSTSLKESTLSTLQTPPSQSKTSFLTQLTQLTAMLLFSPLLNHLYVPFNSLDSPYLPTPTPPLSSLTSTLTFLSTPDSSSVL